MCEFIRKDSVSERKFSYDLLDTWFESEYLKEYKKQNNKMKTLEQVKKHLVETQYSKGAIGQIMGFLIGCKLKESGEVLTVNIGGDRKFSDFLEWFESEEDKTSDLSEEIENEFDARFGEWKRLLKNMEKLLDDLSIGDEKLELTEEEIKQINKLDLRKKTKVDWGNMFDGVIGFDLAKGKDRTIISFFSPSISVLDELFEECEKKRKSNIKELHELQTILKKFEDLIEYMDANDWGTSDVDEIYSFHLEDYKKRFNEIFNK